MLKINDDQQRPLQRPMPSEASICWQFSQLLPGLHSVTLGCELKMFPGFMFMRRQQETRFTFCTKSTWQTQPAVLMRHPRSRFHRFTSSSMQASQFSPLSGPHYPLQQLHLPIILPPQQYLEVSPITAFSPSLFLRARKQLMAGSAGGETTLLSVLALMPRTWVMRQSLASFWCATAVCLGMSSCTIFSLQMLQTRGTLGHLARCASRAPFSTCAWQCWQGTLISEMTLRAILDWCQRRAVLRQQGQCPNFLWMSWMHFSQKILVQQEDSTAALASSRQTGQVKFSSKFMRIIIGWMEEDSVEIVEPKEGEEGEGAEGGERLELSEELQQKFSETITRFSDQMKDYRQGQKNTFRLENPHELELYQIIRIWKSRPCRNEKFLLHLQLVNPVFPGSLVRELFEAMPSIVVYFNEEKMEGKGVMRQENDYFYEGTDKFMNIYSETRGTDYNGEVLNWQPHGQGQLICRSNKDGYVYKGGFFEGKYHGSGELRNSKNVIYIGEFKEDFKNGKGVEMVMKRRKNPSKGENALIRKSMYNGQFKDGYRSGEGVEETSHATYRGEWKNGVKCGKGEMVYKNGDKYEGGWENNEFSGEGVYVEKGNCVYRGSFLEGKYHGEGVMEYENGDKYEGGFERGKKHGQGIYTWEDGDYYDGEWRNDSAEGNGTSMIGTDFYDGNFKNGRKHGVGELTNEEGDVTKALWENNEIKKVIERNGQTVEE